MNYRVEYRHGEVWQYHVILMSTGERIFCETFADMSDVMVGLRRLGWKNDYGY